MTSPTFALGLASQLVVLGEVAAAMLLGGAIGYEREQARRPAGLRTHMMLAGACALIVGLGGSMLSAFGHSHPTLISADPFRLVGGVIAALGFIGAGTIFRSHGTRVEGLTTATALLFSGSVGVCVALGQWWTAVGSTALALIVLRGAWWLERSAQRSSEATNEFVSAHTQLETTADRSHRPRPSESLPRSR